MAALSKIAPSSLAEVAAALYEHYFVHRRPIGSQKDILPVFEAKLGKQLTEQIVESAGTIGKEVLTQNTDEALRQGCFGLPWVSGK